MNAPAWAASLEASGFAEWVRSAGLAYAAVNLVHLLGLALLIGPMLLLDLRILGATRRFPAHQVSAALTPWLLVGLCLLLPSGFALFSADAVPLLANDTFLTKMALLACALINAGLFRLLWNGRLRDWNARPARFGQMQALLSIVLWLAVATCGRLIAYL